MKTIAIPLLAVLVAAAAMAGPPRDLAWEEMVPPRESVSPAGEAALSVSSPAPVLSLDGQRVRLPGFIVPLESDEGGLISEFLLVPYFGACIHVPPPPPNQIVYVTLEAPFDLVSMQQPYWIEGTMRVERYSSDVADTAYMMRGERITKYDY